MNTVADPALAPADERIAVDLDQQTLDQAPDYQTAEQPR